MKIVRLAVVLCLLLSSPVLAESGWHQFRGPGGSGVAEGATPPAKVGSGQPAWKVEVPFGLSSPVVINNRIFLTAIRGRRLVTIAFDARTGDQIWIKEAPEVEIEKVHKASNPAAPTPFVDERRLYVYFGSFGLLSYDHDGNEQWRKEIETPKSLYGTSSSPIPHGDNLILVVDNDRNLPDSKLSQSKVFALKKENGDIVWEAGRPFVRSGWSTPTIWKHDKGEELVVLGMGRADSYDPATGEEKWYATGFSRESISRPIFGNGRVYLSSAQLGGGSDEKVDPLPFWAAMVKFDTNGDEKIERSEISEHFTFPLRPELPIGHPGFGIPLPKNAEKRKERQHGVFGWMDKNKDGFIERDELVSHFASRRGRPVLMAIRPGGSGDVTESHAVWTLRKSIPEIPSPLFYRDHIYMVRNGGIFAGVDAEEGEMLYRERLGSTGQYSASPIAANGHIYVGSNRGLLSVIKAGSDFNLVHEEDLGDPILVTPAIDGNTLYVRTEKYLWAFR